MKNESFSDMKSELMSSKPKLIFITILVVVGAIGLFMNGLKIPGLQGQMVNISYDEMMKEVYLSGLTSAQIAERKSYFVGKRVRWTGTVIDVKPGSWGSSVALSDGEHRSLTDYFLEGITKDKALILSAGEIVRFSGKVDRIEDGMLTGYVYLTGVDLN